MSNPASSLATWFVQPCILPLCENIKRPICDICVDFGKDFSNKAFSAQLQNTLQLICISLNKNKFYCIHSFFKECPLREKIVVRCCGIFCTCSAFSSSAVFNFPNWPAQTLPCNISTQRLATLSQDVATCVEWAGQTHATSSTFSTQVMSMFICPCPWRAPSGPSAHALVQQCQTRTTSCIATSKMLHEIFDRFQI